MKKLFFWIVALATLPVNVLHAQNSTGTWQGSLKAGPQELRIVVKISLENDKPKAVLYSIDQGGQPVTASAITDDGTNIKMTVAAIGGTYEGRLSSDGKSITGTWTQGPSPAPLTLTRATPETAWTIPEPPPPPKPMKADADPSFEVATIKPAKPDGRFSLLVNRSGMLNTTSTSLADLLKFAYDLHVKQITGGPAWLESEKFDVTAKPDTEGLPSINQMKGMIQKLLAERFALTMHREKKELSVYAITVLKTGPKLTKNDSNPNGLPGFGGGGPGGMRVRNATIEEFARVLQANVLDRPVVDQTGLGAVRWDFIVAWTPDGPQAQAPGRDPNALPPPGNPDAPPDIFAAMQQQLGLKLETSKAPVEVVAIDKVEKPSAN